MKTLTIILIFLVGVLLLTFLAQPSNFIKWSKATISALPEPQQSQDIIEINPAQKKESPSYNSHSSPSLKQNPGDSQNKKIISRKKSQDTTYNHPANHTYNNAYYIDTYITSGPKENKTIDNTNKVSFGFEAKIYLNGRLANNIRPFFETKLEGLDKNWVKTYSNQRTIILPGGIKNYTFLVRAGFKNYLDQSPAQRNFSSRISPYFGKIKISSVRIGSSLNPALIILRPLLNKGEKINISHWQIWDNSQEAVIPSGIEKYLPGFNPVPENELFVKPGDTVYLSSAQSPLGNIKAFELNECFGYLKEKYDFPISFSTNCPRPTKQDIADLQPYCKQVILSLRSCESPDLSKNFLVYYDQECVHFLNEHFNYKSCFRNYSAGKNFVLPVWQIYLNNKNLANNKYETIYLKDNNGLLVDRYLCY